MANKDLDGAYRSLLDQVKKIEKRLASEGRIDPRRKISQVLDIMEGADSSLGIVGINAMGPVHQGREALVKLLQDNGDVTIAVMDYQSDAFHKRVQAERDESHRILQELTATLAGIDDVIAYSDLNPPELHIFLHTYPKAAMVIADHDSGEGQMQFNVYPGDRRGLTGKTYLLKAGDGEPFVKGVNFYNALLSNSVGLPIRDLDIYLAEMTAYITHRRLAEYREEL